MSDLDNLHRAEAGHLRSLHSAYDLLLGVPMTTAQFMEAQEKALEDMDTAAEWIYEQCSRTQAKFGAIPRDDVSFADFLLTLSASELLGFAMQYSAAQPARAAKAMTRFSELYLKSRGL